MHSVDDRTALDLAVESRSILLAEYLLLNGATVNMRIPDLAGGSALYRAVAQNDIGMVSLLLKRRSLLEFVDDQNRSPIDLAQECEDADVLTMLRLIIRSVHNHSRTI